MATILMETTMATNQQLVKIIVITKDEYDLIDDFLTYHARLVGAANITVVDNGSTLLPVLECYERWRARGTSVIVDATPFKDAHRFMTKHMCDIKDSCRFIMPLETDEFVYRTDLPPGTAMQPEHLQEVLAGTPENVSQIRYATLMGSVVDQTDMDHPNYSDGAYARPARHITRFKEQGWDKLIVRTATFERMVQWCHTAAFTSGITATEHRLGLLHFHETGRRRRVERAIPVVKSYGYVTAPALHPKMLAADMQLTTRLKGAPIACGHKLDYYGQHVARYHQLLQHRAKNGSLMGGETFERLLYKEDAPEDTESRATKVIDQVAQAFKEMAQHTAAIGAGATPTGMYLSVPASALTSSAGPGGVSLEP